MGGKENMYHDEKAEVYVRDTRRIFLIDLLAPNSNIVLVKGIPHNLLPAIYEGGKLNQTFKCI